MKKAEIDMVLKGRNVFGKEVEVNVVSTLRSTHEWEEKGVAKECNHCPSCISEQSAKDIIRMAEEQKQYTSSPEEYVLGLCIYGLQTKVLTRPRTNLRSCRYFRNGQK